MIQVIIKLLHNKESFQLGEYLLETTPYYKNESDRITKKYEYLSPYMYLHGKLGLQKDNRIICKDTLVFENGKTPKEVFDKGIPFWIKELQIVDYPFEGKIPFVIPKKMLNLTLNNCRLTELPELKRLKTLIIDYNYFESLPELPIDLIKLSCNINKLKCLPTLPGELEELCCNSNFLTELPNLPDKIELLVCHNNQLSKLPSIVSTRLIYLSCAENILTELPELPDRLEYLFCQGNKLTKLPKLPRLQWLDCSSNLLTELPELKHTRLTNLDVCNNSNLKYIPELPKTISIIKVDDKQNHLIEQLKKMGIKDNMIHVYRSDSREFKQRIY